MKRNKMKKNIIGMTLIETLVAISLGISVAIGLYLFMTKLNEKLADSETANVFIKIASAMDTRFSIDGYAASNFTKKDWNNNTEANKFLNSFNGMSSTCSTPDGWVPNVKDPVLKNKHIKSKNIPCNIFKERTPLDAKMTAKLVINAVNNQILTSYISFYYDSNEKMLDAYPRWKNIINEAYNKDTLNNSSKHIYSFMDKSKNKFINDKECIIAKRNCALVIGVASDEATSLIHLSTIGDNKQVGKLSFSRGLLNPQVCQKWSNDSGSWLMEKTICGIENENEKIGFKLGNVNAELISMDKTCQLRDIGNDGYLNIKDADNNTIPVSSKNIPCGLNTQTNGGTFVVTAIVDDANSKELFTEELVANKFNADVLSVYTMTVNEKTNVTGLTDVTSDLILSNHLFAESVKSQFTEGESLRSTNGFNIGTVLLSANSIDNDIVNVSNDMSAATLRTFSINIKNLKTNSFKSNGAFEIGGDIIANTFTATGVLSAESIALSSNFFVTGSGSIGGYGELGGVTNTEKIGVTGNNAIFKSNFFSNGYKLDDNYMIQIVRPSSNVNNGDLNNLDESNINFGVNSHGGMYLRGGLNMPSEFGGSSYTVTPAGDLTAFVNLYISSGCCADAPQQFYGRVGISGTFTIQSNPRFLDVEDTYGRDTGFWIDPEFIVSNPRFPDKQVYRINSLFYNNYRLNSYAAKIGEFENAYNSFNNALHTPGLKGQSGDSGEVGLPGDQGKKGKQGVTGTQGLTGPAYNEKTLIWLPKEVTCGKQDSDMSTKYGTTNNKGAWTYDDVIEGLCTTGKGSIKYFKRLKPIDRSCLSSQFEYDVYECKEAKYRIEPYAFNISVQGNFCLGDDLNNKALDEGNPAKGVIDKDNNTICYTNTNTKHSNAGRARLGWNLKNYISVGEGDDLGSKNKETSLMSIIGKNYWNKVSTCGAESSRTEEDKLGLSLADLIEDGGATSKYTLITDQDLNSACTKQDSITYRKVDYKGLLYGGPNQFEAYRKNDFKDVKNYLKNNSSSCNREQVYEISKCVKGVEDLTKLKYDPHPEGFIKPVPEDSNDGGNGGLTGKYVWLKGSQVCLSGTVLDSYPGSSDWYPSDRINSACSVENAYRSEFLGICGSNNDRNSYQMYVCRDEYYKPAKPELSYRISDIKCLNSTGQAIDSETQLPLPVEKIDKYYPNAISSNTLISVGQVCVTEREQVYNEESNSSQCSAGLTKFSVFDCR